MKRPNFFVVGAPKCGTTSLASWLGAHPNIYMSPAKEPHFYSSDLALSRRYTRESYNELFESANQRHAAVGEASASYLRSDTAIPAIEQDVPEARYVVMLRNPLEMAPSLHWQTVFAGDEDEIQFDRAWSLQVQREEGKKIPRRCRDPQLVQYRLACKLGNQLDRLYSRVERSRVLVLFLEDIQQNPMREWKRTLEFLSVPFWADLEFKPENKAKHWKFRWINSVVGRTYRQLQEKLDIPPLGLNIFTTMRKIATREAPREQLSSEIRRKLSYEFSSDIARLSELTGRDLSHWIANQ